jgi:diguanylate cyclase (GGDEF)-like protein/PAS domain S-box-containing protein
MTGINTSSEQSPKNRLTALLGIETADSLFDDVIEAIGDRISIQDRNFRVLYQNPAHKEYSGDHVGEYCFQSFDSEGKICDGCPVDAVFKRGESATLVKVRGPENNRRYHEIKAYPIKDNKGNLVAAIEVVRNVTERKKINDQLHMALTRIDEEITKSEALVNATGLSITLKDLDFRIRFQSQAHRDLFGSHIGEICYEALSQRDTMCDNCPVAKSLKDGATHVVERRIVNNGKTTYLEETASPLRDANGKIIGTIEVARDITASKLHEEALQNSEARFRAIFENSMDALAVIRDDILVLANPACLAVLGYTHLEEIVGRPAEDHIAPDERQRVIDYAQKRLNKENVPVFYETKGLKKDGSEFDLELNVSAYRLDGEQYTLVVMRDISERKRSDEQLYHMATHDPLTNLPNQTLFADRLAVEIVHSNRRNQKLALMMLDLDLFKEVNDTLGHRVGDQLLQAVGTRLPKLLRESDTIARMGGDEFMILLPGIAAHEDAGKIARKILESLQEPFEIGEHTIQIAASVGIAVFPDDGPEADTLMMNADITMYRAKDLGRNNFQFFSSP